MPLSENDKKLVERLKKRCREKLDSFKEKHITYIECFPNGEKYGTITINNKVVYVPKCVCYQQHIYTCKHNCVRGNRKCKRFLMEDWVCKDLHCSKNQGCLSLSEEKRRKMCKKIGQYPARKSLSKVYKKYLRLFQIWRGLKIQPEKTLSYLEKHGKIKRESPEKETPFHQKKSKSSDVRVSRKENASKRRKKLRRVSD